MPDSIDCKGVGTGPDGRPKLGVTRCRAYAAKMELMVSVRGESWPTLHTYAQHAFTSSRAAAVLVLAWEAADSTLWAAGGARERVESSETQRDARTRPWCVRRGWRGAGACRGRAVRNENSAQDGQAHEEAHVHNPADLIGRRNGRGLCACGLRLGQEGDSHASVRAQGASTAPARDEQHHSPIVVRSSRSSVHAGAHFSSRRTGSSTSSHSAP